MTNNTRASANQAIGGLRMKRAPPVMRAMKALGRDELWKDITECHEMYVVVVQGEKEARKGPATPIRASRRGLRQPCGRQPARTHHPASGPPNRRRWLPA